MNIEGKLDIRLTLAGQSCSQVIINSSRPLTATNIFHGKTPEEVLKILPMIYNICGNAQAQAAETACLQARGGMISEQENKQVGREMLVMVETAKEHLYRILMDWPIYIDEDMSAGELKTVLQFPFSFKRGLFEEGIAFGEAANLTANLHQVSLLIDQLDDLLQRIIFTHDSQDWFSMDNVGLLFEWIEKGETVASRLLNWVRQMSWENLGVNEVEFLPELDQALLLEQFCSQDAEEFIATPCWSNKPCESTSLARQKNHPLIKSLSSEFQNGLLPRIVARLLELAEIPSILREKIKTIENTNESKTGTHIQSKSGMGIGQVEAARGHLVHCVELEQDIVKRYQILAPTEWNFHPHGVVAQGLKSLRTENEILLRKQADMLINAIDPCVAYNITVH